MHVSGVKAYPEVADNDSYGDVSNVEEKKGYSFCQLHLHMWE